MSLIIHKRCEGGPVRQGLNVDYVRDRYVTLHLRIWRWAWRYRYTIAKHLLRRHYSGHRRVPAKTRKRPVEIWTRYTDGTIDHVYVNNT